MDAFLLRSTSIFNTALGSIAVANISEFLAELPSLPRQLSVIKIKSALNRWSVPSAPAFGE